METSPVIKSILIYRHIFYCICFWTQKIPENFFLGQKKLATFTWQALTHDFLFFLHPKNWKLSPYWMSLIRSPSIRFFRAWSSSGAWIWRGTYRQKKHSPNWQRNDNALVPAQVCTVGSFHQRTGFTDHRDGKRYVRGKQEWWIQRLSWAGYAERFRSILTIVNVLELEQCEITEKIPHQQEMNSTPFVRQVWYTI